MIRFAFAFWCTHSAIVHRMRYAVFVNHDIHLQINMCVFGFYIIDKTANNQQVK